MTRPLREVGNEGSQGKIGAFNAAACIGSALGLVARTVGQGVVAANALVLPDDAKAVSIVEVYAVAGTVTGAFTPIVGGAPATTEAGVNATGDIAFQATDAVTLAEVTYLSVEGARITETIPIVGSVGTLLAGKAAKTLISAEITAGISPGATVVVARGGVPASGDAAIDDAGNGIVFNAAQVVVGEATVTYIATPGVGTSKDAIGVLLDGEVEY